MHVYNKRHEQVIIMALLRLFGLMSCNPRVSHYVMLRTVELYGWVGDY